MVSSIKVIVLCFHYGVLRDLNSFVDLLFGL